LDYQLYRLVLRIIFAAVFYDWLQKFVKDSKEKMEVYCDDFDVWDFYSGFSFAIAQTEIDSSVTSILNSLTPLNTLVLGALVLALVLKEDRFGVF
jgi:hypothetical protein